MKMELPDIVQCAERLLAEVALAVRGFTRAHRYEYGVDLKQAAFKLATLTHRAWREAEKRAQLVDKLIRRIDQFATLLRLGKKLQVFASFGQFEALARTTNQLGRRAGGWRKRQHLKSQNPTAQGTAPPERAQILSSRAASAEAKS